ncbi:MAG: ketoacyl-ACP synthase III [Nitrospirota bacterium]|nr:ketoacyl-ACP synthase III [Nitrospirota bacterium]
MRAKITGTGSYVPETVLTNADLERMVDTTDEWIMERTGIRERRIAAANQGTSDLAAEAARRALDAAGLAASEIDLILVATVTPDMLFPSTACLVQGKIGATRAAAYDLAAACSGFLYGLSVANSHIVSGQYKNILVIGAETLSRVVNWKDRGTCILFGDGAGAVVLQATKGNSGIVTTLLKSDPSLWQLLCLPSVGSRIHASPLDVEASMHTIQMKGNETFKAAVKALDEIVDETLGAAGVKAAEVDLLIPHQANIRIIQATAKRLKMPMDKVYLILEKYGNTSAASVPMALDEAVRTGAVTPGKTILMEAFGGGLTWASALVKW